MRKTYIADGLQQYLDAEHKIWHMPGHKRKPVFDKTGDACSRLDAVMAYDVTEVPGTDDLYEPEGFIRDSLMQLKEIYGTYGSYYVVNGATGGIFSAIYACTSRGDTVIMAKNCHKSVYNAVRVLGLTPVYVHPVWETQDKCEGNTRVEQPDASEYGQIMIPSGLIDGYIDVAKVEQLCIEHPQATAIIVTSPTYDGVVSDIRSISLIAKKYDKYLIVDEAHGAHLPFLMPSLSAISMGADIVVQSLHKTLPALTQTALLHVCTEALREKTEASLSMFLSSSPSYIMLMSMEQAVCYAAEQDKTAYMQILKEFRDRCKALSQIRMLDTETVKAAGAYGYDETRLVFYADVPGPRLLEELEKAGDIVCEMAGERHVVLISTMVDEKADFDGLYDALCCVDEKLAGGEVYKNNSGMEAGEKQAEDAGLRSRIGTKAEEPIYVYPPGSYIVEAGEVITEQAVEKILSCKAAGLRIRGI